MGIFGGVLEDSPFPSQKTETDRKLLANELKIRFEAPYFIKKYMS